MQSNNTNIIDLSFLPEEYKKETLNKILDTYKISLPTDYKFDREKANERNAIKTSY